MKPYVTFRGERINMSTQSFIALFLTCAIVGFAAMWCIIGGVFKFAGWWGLLAYLLLTLEITVDSREYSVIPHNLTRGIVNTAVSVSAFIYFWM